MKNFTLVVITKNAEENLAKLLNLFGNAVPKLIIDDYSTDNTVIIAKQYKANVIQRNLNNDFATQRNFALEKVKTDWALFLDSDELPNDTLIKEIDKLENIKNISAYLFKRIDTFWNREVKYGEVLNCFVARLVNKNNGQFVRAVHEEWEPRKGKVIKLNSELKHYPHKNIAEFLTKINYYSTINASYFYKNNKKTNAIDILFTPLFKFVYSYFFKLGFLDGANGFVYSFMMSFHSFLSRSKLYLLENK
jgi:glycosyltransferase involved in cell wall biosynthesis